MAKLDLKVAQSWAEDYDNQLTADDKRFNNSVIVRGQFDQLYLNYPRAFCLSDDSWFYVFTEHYGWFVFATDEVSCSMFKRQKVSPKD